MGGLAEALALMGGRSRSPLWALAVPMAVLLVVGGALGGAYYAWTLAHRPAQAPDFRLTTTGFEAGAEGPPRDVALSDFRGRTLVLDFMGVTCTACRFVEKDVLRPLHAKYGGGGGVAFLSVDAWAGFAGESTEELVAFQRDSGHPWPYALDTDRALTKYGGYGIPKLVIVDRDGFVVLDEAGDVTFGQADAAVRDALAGIAPPAKVLQAGLVTLAFVAGAASFLAPCSIGMLPAYFGFLLSATTGQGTVPQGPVPRRRLARGTLLMAIGILAVYAALTLLVYLAGARLRAWVPFLAPALAVLLIAVAAGMLAGVDWPRLRPLRRGGEGPTGFFGFGLAYGLAAFGCTGPAFLPIIGTAFLDGAAQGVAAFAAFSLAILLFLGMAAALVAAGNQSMWRRVAAHSPAIQKASAVLMILGGAYVLWFHVAAAA